MKISRSMAMMSHLSDVQEMIYHEQTPDNQERMRMKINFVKVLMHREEDEFTNDELNVIWRDTHEKFGK